MLLTVYWMRVDILYMRC